MNLAKSYTLTAAATFLLPLTAVSSAFAESARTAQTLTMNQSLAVYARDCSLSVKSAGNSKVMIQCSKSTRETTRAIPPGQHYLAENQVTTIKAKSCLLTVTKASAQLVKIKCGAATPTPTPQPSATATPTPTNSPVSTATPIPTSISTPVPTVVPTVAPTSTPTPIPTTTMSLSVSDLGLSVSGVTEFGVSGTPSSGLSRIITVTNSGSSAAANLSIQFPTFPSGTTASSTCGSTLAAAASCVITIVPGSTASSDGSNPCTQGSVPVAGAVNVTAGNATTVSANILVLGYGCIYQGGYIYYLDDTTSNTTSVGGKVFNLADLAAAFPNGVVWSSNGGSGGGSGSMDSPDTSIDTLPGIDESSTTSTPSPSYSNFLTQFASTYTNSNPFASSSFLSCDGSFDGNCNSSNIIAFYSQFVTNNTESNGGSPPFTASSGPTPLTNYAAGLCTQTISAYSDWYLPSICEMGYGSGACGSSGSPSSQNVQSNLVDFGGLNVVSGFYWSSTLFSAAPLSGAWAQFFASAGGSTQVTIDKSELIGVRCSRDLS